MSLEGLREFVNRAAGRPTMVKSAPAIAVAISRSSLMAANMPVEPYVEGTLPTLSTQYDSMNVRYREYRRDTLVRKCINALGITPTMKGFETELALTDPGDLDEEGIAKELEKYTNVKNRADVINKAVNLDSILKTAIIKAKIYGKVGFEIFPTFQDTSWPRALLPLVSTDITPKIESDWTCSGYDYKGRAGKPKYEVQQMLYFANLSLEADKQGLSAIEPVQYEINARRAAIKTDLPESFEHLWAPQRVDVIDTTGHSEAEAKVILTNHLAQSKPGKTIAVNHFVKSTIIDMSPDISDLIVGLEYLDYCIIGNFEVPRFLLGREKQVNRATAEQQWESFIEGPITDIQRWIRRELESQWYDQIVRKELKVGKDDELPVRIKHVWNTITKQDILKLSQAIGNLWGAMGHGAIGGNYEKAWEIMGWPQKELEDWQPSPNQSLMMADYADPGTTRLMLRFAQLVNQVESGTSKEEVLASARQTIRNHMDFLKAQRRIQLETRIGRAVPLTPEDERKFDADEKSFLSYFEKILNDALPKEE